MTPGETDRASANAAWTLALALPGDTVLYLLLPIYAAGFGVSLPEAGILLAANRLVRIAGYGWIARLYASRGPRTACLAASIGAALAALSYATLSGLWPLLAGRLLWGLCFAAMNIANQALPTALAEGAARRSSTSRAIIASGPAVGLVAGAMLANQFGPRVVFFVLTAVACIAPFFAMRLPPSQERPVMGGPRFERPGPVSLWSFASGLTLDGVFFFGLGLLAAGQYPKGAVVAAGLAMALRYAMEVAFSPIGGRLASRFGVRELLLTLSIAAAAGLAAQAAPGWWLWCGAIATVALRAVMQPLIGPLVAQIHPGPERVPALARQATWRDIGAGAGPLAAGFLFPSLPPSAIYLGSAAILVAATLPLLGVTARSDDGASGKPDARMASRES